MIPADPNDQLFRKTLVFCAWSGIAAIVVFSIGGVFLGQFIPPLLFANDSPDEVVRKLTENLLAIRIGSAFMLLGFTLFAPFGAGIAAQTRRSERAPGFSYAQLIIAACSTTVAMLVAFAWALMVFRPDASEPTLVQFIADTAYFLALFSAPVFGAWCVMIALSILFANEGEEPFPRWVAFANLWAALLYVPGMLVLFFKHGLFSYHGIVGLWIPIVAFFLWVLVMCVAMFQAVRKSA